MTELHFLDSNPGGTPVVVLLHGLGANATSWSLQLDRLSQAGMRPLAIDLPGFGESSFEGKGWKFKSITKILASFIAEQTEQPVYLVGLSMGGIIAQQMVIDYPEMVSKLVLVSTFSYLRPENLSQWAYFLARLLVVHFIGLKTQAKIVAKRIFPAPDQEALRQMAEEQISSADPRAYRAALRNLALFNSSKKLKFIKIPTLVVSGDRDTTVTPARQKFLADHLPNSKHVIISQAGHALTIDQYEKFNAVLLEFLAGR